MSEFHDPKYRYVSPNANEFNEEQSLAFEHEKRQKSNLSLLGSAKRRDSDSSSFRLHNVDTINNFDDASLSKKERNLFSGASHVKSTRYEAVSRADVDVGIGTGRKTTGRLSKNEKANGDQKRVQMDAAQIKEMNRNEEDDEARQLAEEAAYQRRLKRRISRNAKQEKQFQLPNLNEAMSDSEDDQQIGRALDLALLEHERSRKNSEAKNSAVQKPRYQSAEEVDYYDDGEESDYDEENNDISYNQLHRPYVTSNSGKPRVRTGERMGTGQLPSPTSQPARPNGVHQLSAQESRRLPTNQQQPPLHYQQQPNSHQQHVPVQQHQQQVPFQQQQAPLQPAQQQQQASVQPQQHPQYVPQQQQQQLPMQSQQQQQQFHQSADQVTNNSQAPVYAPHNGAATGTNGPGMNVPGNNWVAPVNTTIQQQPQPQLVGSGPQYQQQQPYAFPSMPGAVYNNVTGQPLPVTSMNNNSIVPNTIGVQYMPMQQQPSSTLQQQAPPHMATQQPLAPVVQQPHAGLQYGATYPSAQLLQPTPYQSQQLQQQAYHPNAQVQMMQQPVQYQPLQQQPQFQPQLLYAQQPAMLQNMQPSQLPLLQTQLPFQQQQFVQPMSLFSLSKDPNPQQTATLFQFDTKPNPFFPSAIKLSPKAQPAANKLPLPLGDGDNSNAENEVPAGWPHNANNANRTDYVAENVATLGKQQATKSYAANHTYRKAAAGNQQQQQQPMSADPSAAKGNLGQGRGDKVATAPPGGGGGVGSIGDGQSTTGADADNETEGDGEQSELLWQKRVQSLAQRSKGKAPANKAGGGAKQPVSKQPQKTIADKSNNTAAANNTNGRQLPAPVRQPQQHQQQVRQQQNSNQMRALAQPIRVDAVVDPERIPSDGSLPLRRTVITEDGQKVDIDINLKMLSPHNVLEPVGRGQGQGQRSHGHPRAPGEAIAVGLQPINPHHHQHHSQQQRDTFRAQDRFQERLAATNNQTGGPYYDNWDEVPVGKHAARPAEQPNNHQRQHSGGSQYQVLPSISTDESQVSEPGGYVREYQRQRAAAAGGGGGGGGGGRGGGEAGYKKYNINDYRRIKQDASNKLGGLGPNLDDEKREKLEKQKNYARKINEKNMHDLNDRPPPAPKHVDRDTRRRTALEYARGVPKPKPGATRAALEKQPSAGSRRGGSSRSRRHSAGDSEVDGDDVSERGDYAGAPAGDVMRHQQQQQQQQQQLLQAPASLYPTLLPPPPQSLAARPKPDTRTMDLEREMQELQRLQERHERERQEVATLLHNMQSVLA